MSSNFTAATVPTFPARVEAAPSVASTAELEDEILALFDAWQPSMLRYAVSLGLSVHDGEDVIQETFLALFRHLSLGRSRSNLRSWLFAVTHNLALRRRIRNHSALRLFEFPSTLADLYSDPSPGPEEQLLFTEHQGQLLNILNALPERDRWCLQLRAEGLRYREIARVVGISLGSVSMSLTRSLARMARAEGR